MTARSETVRIIRVFVSSPGDVADERNAMKEVADVINRSDGRGGGFRLELFRWEEGVVPQIGPKPQQVVDSQTPVYNVYVGILKHRFGTPAGRHGSGTEKEFCDALKRWGDTGWPWILFYFCGDPIDPSQLDLDQYGKVAQFQKQLETKRRGLYATYNGARGTADSFYDRVTEHLRRIVQQLPTPREEEPSRESPPHPPTRSRSSFWPRSRTTGSIGKKMEGKEMETTEKEREYEIWPRAGDFRAASELRRRDEPVAVMGDRDPYDAVSYALSQLRGAISSADHPVPGLRIRAPLPDVARHGFQT